MLSFTASLGCLLNVENVNLTCVADGLPRPDIVFLKGADTPFTCGAGSSCNISNGVIRFFQVQSMKCSLLLAIEYMYMYMLVRLFENRFTGNSKLRW